MHIHLESLIDREQAGFLSKSYCDGHINNLRLSVEQYAEYRYPLRVLFIDFEKASTASIKSIYILDKKLHRGKILERIEVLSRVR